MGVFVAEVKSKAEMRQFVSFPHSLFKGDRNWVPPLISDELALFDRSRNPAFETCRCVCWLAYKNGKIAGRIAGIISEPFIAKWHKNYARFGWFDFVDDMAVSGALMNAVIRWAAEQGMTAVNGPMGFTDFDPEGMLVEGFDLPGTMQTIYNYAYYPVHLSKLGFRKDADWLEYEIAVPQEVPERLLRFSELVTKRYGLHVLQVRRNRELLKYAPGIFSVLNAAYAGLYGVVPLSKKQEAAYTSQYFSFIRKQFISVVLDHSGQVAAFAITVPSLSKALNKANGRLLPFGFIHLLSALYFNSTVDLFLIAIRPDLQGRGLNSLLLRDLIEKFNRQGVKQAITHPVLEENRKVIALWKDHQGVCIKRRRCFIREI